MRPLPSRVCVCEFQRIMKSGNAPILRENRCRSPALFNAAECSHGSWPLTTHAIEQGSSKGPRYQAHPLKLLTSTLQPWPTLRAPTGTLMPCSQKSRYASPMTPVTCAFLSCWHAQPCGASYALLVAHYVIARNSSMPDKHPCSPRAPALQSSDEKCHAAGLKCW